MVVRGVYYGVRTPCSLQDQIINNVEVFPALTRPGALKAEHTGWNLDAVAPW